MDFLAILYAITVYWKAVKYVSPCISIICAVINQCSLEANFGKPRKGQCLRNEEQQMQLQRTVKQKVVLLNCTERERNKWSMLTQLLAAVVGWMMGCHRVTHGLSSPSKKTLETPRFFLCQGFRYVMAWQTLDCNGCTNSLC